MLDELVEAVKNTSKAYALARKARNAASEVVAEAKDVENVAFTKENEAYEAARNAIHALNQFHANA